MSIESLEQFRENYLAAFKNPVGESKDLLNLLDEAESRRPDLLISFDPDFGGDNGLLIKESVRWSADYFSNQILSAKFNFSRERILHLIEVREHLRKQGVKGFVPVLSADDIKTKRESSVTSNYQPSLNLKKFMKNGDLLTIRTALRLELNDNRQTSADLRAAVSWCKQNKDGLFESYEEKAFARAVETDRQLWNIEYYDNQTVYLKTNFCEKRLLHLIEVREYLRDTGAAGFIPKQKNTNTSDGKGYSTKTEKTSGFGDRAPNIDRNPVFQKALMIGGAIATCAILLLIILR